MKLPLHLMKYYVFMIPITKTYPADMECGLSEKLAEVAAPNYYSVQYKMEVTTCNVWDIPLCQLWQWHTMFKIPNMIAINEMQMKETIANSFMFQTNVILSFYWFLSTSCLICQSVCAVIRYSPFHGYSVWVSQTSGQWCIMPDLVHFAITHPYTSHHACLVAKGK